MSLTKFSSFIAGFLVFNIFLCAYAAQDATNSSRNKVYIQENQLTSRDQGRSKQDIEVTRSIRQKVVAENSFSSSAKNVKIITNAGSVTLKGPVQTQIEKDRILEIAISIAGKNHVNNEIEVIKE
jgi:hyperosmotically inducible periplasmic protein